MGSVTCIHFVLGAKERLVQQKQSGWKTLIPQTINAELVRKVEGTDLVLVIVRMYPLCTGEFKNYKVS